MDIERLIFENSMLCVAMYDTLRSIDYKNNLVPAKVLARTKECYDNILNSNASEIVVTKYDVHEYGRFYSDYIELFLDKPKGFSINKSDVYLGLSESIKGVLYSLQSLLTEYSGTDTNLITAAQYALTLLKGLYSKNMLDVVAKYIPKKQHVYTTVPKQLEDIINAIDAVAIVQDKKHEDYTTLNTIYTTQDINNIYDSFKATLFTKNEIEKVAKHEGYTEDLGYGVWQVKDNLVFNSSRVSTGFGEMVDSKLENLYYGIGNSIKAQKDSITNTLKDGYNEATYYLEKLYAQFEYPKYYTESVNKKDANDMLAKELNENSKEKPEKQTKAETHKAVKHKKHVSINFKKIGEVIAWPFVMLWKLLVNIGGAISEAWFNIRYFIRKNNIGKILYIPLLPFMLIYWLFKGIGMLLTNFGGKAIAIIGVVVVIVGAVLGGSYFIFRPPCCFDYGRVIEESSCTRHGVVQYTCKTHGETKTESLPYSHNILESGKCSKCGSSINTSHEMLTYDNGSGLTVDMLPNYTSDYKTKTVKHMVITPYVNNTLVNLVTFRKKAIIDGQEDLTGLVYGTTANRITIYSHENMVIDLRHCTSDLVEISGSVKSVINADNVKNLVVYGNINTLELQDYTKLNCFIATGGIAKIEADTLGKALYVDKCMDISNISRKAELKHVYVSKQHSEYKSFDGVVYAKDMSKVLYYPIKKSGSTFNIHSGVSDVSNLGDVLKYATDLRTLVFPDSVRIGYIDMKDGSKIESYEFSKHTTEVYFVSFKDSLKRVSFEDTTLTFKVYTLYGGVYTEYSFYLETTNPEDTCEFMRDLQDAKYVRVDE